ncbi:uracil-DNA glycosylase [Erwinia sp. PK3-005]
MFNESILPTEPKSLRYESNIRHRQSLLTVPHMQPLTAYVENLRKRLGNNVFIPDFDPLDGGINAEFIFLFEKPGPQTDFRNGGSGFISRDNNDDTAKAIFCFMQNIGLDRKRTLLWNTIPAWNGSRAFKSLHVRDGIRLLDELLPLLPNLKTIILIGKQAQKAGKDLKDRGLKVSESDHPSPIVKARYRHRWEQIPAAWAEAVSANKRT